MKRQISADAITSLSSSACRAVKLAFKDYDERKCRTAIARIDQFVLESKSDSSLCKSRKQVVPIRNLLEGFLDGRDELVASDLKSIRKRASNFYKEFRAEISTVLESRSRKQSTSSEKEVQYDDYLNEDQISKLSLDDKKRYLETIDSEATPRVLLDNIRKAIEYDEDSQNFEASFLKNISELRDLGAKLPKKVEGSFALIKAPILPLMKYSPELKDTLRKAGIKTQEIDKGYNVFMDQLLLVFPTSEAKTKDGKPTTDAKVAAKILVKSLKENDNYIQDCLEVINAHGSTEYTLLSSHYVAHPNNLRGLSFAWIIPEVTLNKLLKAQIIIKTWDFPIPRAWKKLEVPSHKRPEPTEKPKEKPTNKQRPNVKYR